MKNHILIVDDDRQLRTFTAALLKEHGFEVSELSSADNLLRQVRQHGPDLVLLDHHMEGVEGLAALKDLRKRHMMVPVVMLTADSNQSVILQCFREGADDFIQKPYDEDFLVVVIKRTLARKGTSLKDAVFLLLKYCRHKEDCDFPKNWTCTCGMADAVTAAVDATHNVTD